MDPTHTESSSIAIDAAHDGARVDKMVVEALPGLGRAGARRMFDRGAVRLNGQRVRKGDIVHTGDVLEVVAPKATGTAAVADPDAPLTVVLETADLVVLDKPAGQPTAPLEPGETGTLANALVARYPEMATIGYSPREPGLVHRLDTDTSGLVIAARTEAAFAALVRALKDERIAKTYQLVCAAEGLAESGTIDFPLAPHPKDRRRVYACMHPRDVARYAPRPAATHYTVVRTAGPWALVEANAPRAMRHQIRVHFAAIGHPLVGDALYGGPEMPGLGRHALHASQIVYPGEAGLAAFTTRSQLPLALAALVGGEG